MEHLLNTNFLTKFDVKKSIISHKFIFNSNNSISDFDKSIYFHCFQTNSNSYAHAYMAKDLL